MFWQNAAETWVDIYNPHSEKNVLSSIVSMVSGSGQADPLAAHFMSEGGVVDAFIMLGPGPNEAFKQYTDLTGSAPLPQVWFITRILFILLPCNSRFNICISSLLRVCSNSRWPITNAAGTTKTRTM